MRGKINNDHFFQHFQCEHVIFINNFLNQGRKGSETDSKDEQLNTAFVFVALRTFTSQAYAYTFYVIILSKLPNGEKGVETGRNHDQTF